MRTNGSNIKLYIALSVIITIALVLIFRFVGSYIKKKYTEHSNSTFSTSNNSFSPPESTSSPSKNTSKGLNSPSSPSESIPSPSNSPSSSYNSSFSNYENPSSTYKKTSNPSNRPSSTYKKTPNPSNKPSSSYNSLPNSYKHTFNTYHNPSNPSKSTCSNSYNIPPNPYNNTPKSTSNSPSRYCTFKEHNYAWDSTQKRYVLESQTSRSISPRDISLNQGNVKLFKVRNFNYVSSSSDSSLVSTNSQRSSKTQNNPNARQLQYNIDFISFCKWFQCTQNTQQNPEDSEHKLTIEEIENSSDNSVSRRK